MALVVGTNCGFVTTAPTATPTGDGTAYSNTYARGFKCTAPAGAYRVKELGWWITSSADNLTEANWEIALYTHDSGNDRPGSIIQASRTNARGTTKNVWLRASADIPVAAGTTYWIVVQADGLGTSEGTIYDLAGGAADKYSHRYPLTTLPDPFGVVDGGDDTAMVAYYAAYDAEGADPTGTKQPTAPTQWQLELEVSGSTLRFATAGMDFDGAHFAGALRVDGEPTLEVDPYEGTASAASADMTLMPLPSESAGKPLLRPCDLEDTYGTAFSGMAGRLYRHEPGTDTRELIVRGHVRDPKADESGNLSFSLVDFSERYDRFRLPWYTVTTDLWADADADDQGRKAPIAYGTFTGVEVPNVDGTNDYHLISHHIGSEANGSVGSATGSAVTLSNTTDSDGTEVARLEFTGGDTSGQDVSVNGTGYLDDSDGTYTGTADALIANVADQLHHLAVEVVGVSSDYVDDASFVAFRELHTAHVNALVIGSDDNTSYFPVAAEALRPYRAACFVERGMLTLKRLLFDAAPVRVLRDGEDLIGLRSVEWRGYEQTPGGLEFKYSRGWVRKKKQWDYRGRIVVDANDYPPFLAAYNAGSDPLVIEAPHVQDADTAQLLVDTMKELHSKARRYVEADVTWECGALKIFDTVAVTCAKAPSRNGAGWTDKRFVITAIRYGLGTSTLTLLEC